MANGSALKHAVDNRRSDIVALLLERGTNPDHDQFMWACYEGDPDTIRVFLECGADPVKGFPFYRALTHCLKPVLGLYKSYVEKRPEIATQGDMALCYFAKQNNLRGVSLMLWAGARPEQEVPDADKPDRDYPNDCALKEAVRAGHLAVLRRMKPENYPHLFTELVGACWNRNSEVLEHLRKVGATVTLDPDQGSEALRHLVWQLGWDADPSSPLGKDPQQFDLTMQRIECLVQKGARWIPHPDHGVRDTRRHIRKVEPEKILRLFTLFKEHGVVPDQFLEELVGTPTMSAHLGPKFGKAIHELFYPTPKPPGMLARGKIMPVPSQPWTTPTLPQLKSRTEDYIWQTIRNIPYVEFWKVETWQDVNTFDFRKNLHLNEDDEYPLYDIAQAAAERVNEKARSFSVTVDGRQYQQHVETLKIRLEPEHEWRDVMNEAWSKVENPPPRQLSTPALLLYSWLKDSAFPAGWIPDRTLSWKAGFRGRMRVVDHYLWELRRKLGKGFCFESRGDRWDKKYEHRIWVEGEISLEGPAPAHRAPDALNPAILVDLEACGKREFDHWRDFIHAHLLKTRPAGKAPVHLVWIESRAQMRHIFPELVVERYGPEDKLAEFWNHVALHPDIITSHDFRDEAEAWFVNLRPRENWEEVLESLAQIAGQPTLRDKYGLSSDAAKLLEWIEQLPPESFEGKWTPVVEDEDELHIGLSCPWEEENFSSYVQLLIEEINERTAYDLRLQPWRDGSDIKTRIRVAKRYSAEDELLAQIQLYALQKGNQLDGQKLRRHFRKLMEGQAAARPPSGLFPQRFCGGFGGLSGRMMGGSIARGAWSWASRMTRKPTSPNPAERQASSIRGSHSRPRGRPTTLRHDQT